MPAANARVVEILNHLGYLKGEVTVAPTDDPISAYAASISIPESQVTGQKLREAGYQWRAKVEAPAPQP